MSNSHNISFSNNNGSFVNEDIATITAFDLHEVKSEISIVPYFQT